MQAHRKAVPLLRLASGPDGAVQALQRAPTGPNAQPRGVLTRDLIPTRWESPIVAIDLTLPRESGRAPFTARVTPDLPVSAWAIQLEEPPGDRVLQVEAAFTFADGTTEARTFR